MWLSHGSLRSRARRSVATDPVRGRPTPTASPRCVRRSGSQPTNCLGSKSASSARPTTSRVRRRDSSRRPISCRRRHALANRKSEAFRRYAFGVPPRSSSPATHQDTGAVGSRPRDSRMRGCAWPARPGGRGATGRPRARAVTRSEQMRRGPVGPAGRASVQRAGRSEWPRLDSDAATVVGGLRSRFGKLPAVSCVPCGWAALVQWVGARERARGPLGGGRHRDHVPPVLAALRTAAVLDPFGELRRPFASVAPDLVPSLIAALRAEGLSRTARLDRSG